MKTIFPEELNIKNPNRSILTIYTGEEHFSLSLYNPEEQGSFLYKELSDEDQTDAFAVFKEVFFDNPFFSLPFRKVWIMNRTPNFLFIPDAINKEKTQDDFLHFLFPERQGTTLNHSISHTGINVLYQLPEAIHHFMLRSFAAPEFIHYSTPLITYFLKKSRNSNVRQMIVNLRKKGLDIFCFSEGTFILGNYFPCKSLSDMVYFILFTWKQLQWDQLNDRLLISGNTGFKDELTEKLAFYIQEVHPLTIPSENHFEGIDTNQIPFELATLSLCEL